MQCVVELVGSPEGRPALRPLLRPHRHGVPRRTPSHSSGGVPGITTPSPDQVDQAAEVRRLDQVVREPCLLARPRVLIRPVTAEGDPLQPQVVGA